MTDYLDKLKEATWKNRAANHMLTVTYPLIKDQKLLLGVLDSLLASYLAAFTSAVYYERFKRTIPHFKDNKEGIMLSYNMYVQKRMNLSVEYTKIYNKMAQIKEEHKRSPVEFSRKNSFVICDDKYGLTKVTPELLTSWIQQGRQLLAQLEQVGMI